MSHDQTPAPGAEENGTTTPQPESTHQIGVGPWDGPWPEGDHWDEDLLREGDRRNVLDHYRYWKHDAIVAELDTRRHAFHVAIENWQHDLNIGTVVRTANAFLAAEVHIIGRRRWNRRGAMVTDKYQHVRHHSTVEEFVQWARGEGLAIIGIDIFPDSQQLETYDLPRECVLVFGQEGPGLSEEVHRAAGATLSIEQFGSTRSINAASAAGIAMHAWIRRHVFGQHP
ncbi:TrmH family RNA methyltransferase [Zhihengliuella flava]|uniref:tRNA G18 (Ribose-2'-O)-methylase SpoU n=1 Tax=Zhihengliuella flava TaxID=1285193 RepID=A0A931GJ45_9MICC|nr:tRNA G18 (ribose-2'-O)-methylase SpoU [Zhihengliuella flava]